MLLPPRHGARVALGAGQQFEVRRKGAEQRLIRTVRRPGEAEHRGRAGNRTVGLDFGADIDFGHVWFTKGVVRAARLHGPAGEAACTTTDTIWRRRRSAAAACAALSP